jgi:hypothetical protein
MVVLEGQSVGKELFQPVGRWSHFIDEACIKTEHVRCTIWIVEWMRRRAEK